jgi:ferredoxin
MALLIRHTCTNCDMCEPECPNDAIFMGAEIFEINPDKCTECVGYYEEPQCQKVCPITKCIIIDPAHIESQETLMEKFVHLVQTKQIR